MSRHAIGSGPGARLRVLQLSDLHMHELGDHPRRVARVARDLEPDLVVLTGDSIDRAGAEPLFAEFLDLLGAPVPKIVVPGNWEYYAEVDLDAMARALESRNGRLLVNQSSLLTHGGRELLVTGLDDWVEGRPDYGAAMAGIERPANHLLLAHCPILRESIVELEPGEPRPDLVLSGHTHGGQVALFGWAPVLPYGSGRYFRGWYRDARPWLYVSRGIGTVIVPVRLGSVPEVAMFDWTLT